MEQVVPKAGDEPVTFTMRGFRRGFWMAQPLAPGVFMYAAVFGMLASEKGLSMLQALLMSAFIYSGSAQLAALQGWGTTAASLVALLTPLVVTILVMNARYVLYGAAIQPWLRHTTTLQAWGSLFVMGDGNWVLSVREYERGWRDAGFLFGSGFAMFAPWMGGTALGFALANNVADPARFGLDFMLVSFATAMAVSLWKGKSDLWPAAAAALVAWALYRWVPGSWYIVGAGIAGGVMGAVRHGR